MTDTKYAYAEHAWAVLAVKDNEAMQQLEFQQINRSMKVKKYGKTFVGNLPKPLSLPSEKRSWIGSSAVENQCDEGALDFQGPDEQSDIGIGY